VGKTEQDVRDAIGSLLDSGFMSRAFDTEIIYIPLAKSILGDRVPMHAANAYPMGRTTVTQKLRDLERARKIGVTDTCMGIDWQALFSGRYSDLESEVRAVMEEFGGAFIKLAFIIPATLMSDTEMMEVLRALDNAGAVSVKVNPGTKLGVSFEEVAFIKRNFPHRFDIHPSGNIRSLGEVERYLEMGCDNIHTVSSLDLTQEFIKKQLLKYGGTLS
jgi:deoxyribose-phosphate aldolase